MVEILNEKKIPSEFYFACRNNDLEFVLQSLNERPLEELDRMEMNNSTALHAACYYKNIDIVKLLLDRGFTRRVINKFGKTPIDETDSENIRQLFLRPKLLNRFGGEVTDEEEKSRWIVVEQKIIQDRITDTYKGNRLEYGIFQPERIIQQLIDMPKYDVIQRFFRRAVEEKDCTRLIQAYTAETEFYKRINNYLLARNGENDLLQFIQTIYFNQQLHERYSYEGLCYRSIKINFEDQLKLYKKGIKILNRTFISTTRDRQIAEEYIQDNDNEKKLSVMMIFKIRQRHTALNIRNISEFSQEEEILIMCDSIFKVVNVTKKDDFYYEIELQEPRSNYRT